MPLWLLECLLQNKTPSVPLTKVSFVLLPFKEPGVEPLPELLNTYVRFPLAYTLDTEGFMRQLCRQQSKLTASRFLRVRKLTVHVSYPYVADLSRIADRPSRSKTSSRRLRMVAPLPCLRAPHLGPHSTAVRWLPDAHANMTLALAQTRCMRSSAMASCYRLT